MSCSGHPHRNVRWNFASGKALIASGAVEGEFYPQVAADAQALADYAEILLIALPAYGHKAVMDALADHMRARTRQLSSAHTHRSARFISLDC